MSIHLDLMRTNLRCLVPIHASTLDHAIIGEIKREASKNIDIFVQLVICTVEIPFGSYSYSKKPVLNRGRAQFFTFSL